MIEMHPPLEGRCIRNGWPKTLSDEHILPRSRLYDLAPYQIGTPWCESLTGYINRLGVDSSCAAACACDPGNRSSA